MANLKEIRNRITSVKSTMQITSAMKMVAAAKLKKAQDAITAMRPYANKLTELLQGLSANLGSEGISIYAEQREVKRVLLVVFTSNRGLCGAFNSNIIKECISLIHGEYADQQVDLITLGKKANDLLGKKYSIIDDHSEIYDDLNFQNVGYIAEKLMNMYADGQYDQIIFLYNKFKNAATQIVTREQFLPIVSEENTGIETDYIFEPSSAEIVLQLIPKSLKTQLYKSVRDSYASEHGARMTAMHMATDNASELKDELTLTYNKARQAAITKEILEIVSGAEALSN